MKYHFQESNSPHIMVVDELPDFVKDSGLIITSGDSKIGFVPSVFVVGDTDAIFWRQDVMKSVAEMMRSFDFVLATEVADLIDKKLGIDSNQH